MRVNSLMILVVLSTHAELASATGVGALLLGNGSIRKRLQSTQVPSTNLMNVTLTYTRMTPEEISISSRLTI